MRVIKVLAVLLAIDALNPLEVSAQQMAGIAPCGVPVFVYPTGMGGMATIYFGQPVVIIDPPVAAGDPALGLFTIWHECGHHVLGHMLPQGLMARWYMSAKQELEADCYAAGHVPPSVAAFAANFFISSQGNFSPAPGYPTGNMRAATIMACAQQ